MEMLKFYRELEAKFGEEKAKWLQRVCFNNPCACPDQEFIIKELWREAEDTEAFLELVRKDERLLYNSQAYAEFGRILGWGMPYRADKCDVYTTYSDAGCVRVTDLAGTFSVNIDNGYGDGQTKVLVSERVNTFENNFNTDMLDYKLYLDGEFAICNYDCNPFSKAPETVATLKGCYQVYSRNRVVAFNKIGD